MTETYAGQIWICAAAQAGSQRTAEPKTSIFWLRCLYQTKTYYLGGNPQPSSTPPAGPPTFQTILPSFGSANSLLSPHSFRVMTITHLLEIFRFWMKAEAHAVRRSRSQHSCPRPVPELPKLPVKKQTTKRVLVPATAPKIDVFGAAVLWEPACATCVMATSFWLTPMGFQTGTG
jgi:hypothetical protein